MGVFLGVSQNYPEKYPQMTLSDRQIKNAKPQEKPYKLADGGGLYLYVTPKGTKSFRLKFRFDGKEQVLTIGKYPHVSLSEARAMAETAKTQIAQGINPAAQKQAEKQQAQEAALNTFAAVAKEWHRVHQCSPNHAARIWRYMETDVLPHIGSLQLDEIRVSDIQALLERVMARNVGNTAEKIRQWIGVVYEYAAQRELTERNPAKRLKGFVEKRETVHRRALPLSELKTFYQRLKEARIDPANRIALLLLILTFPRSNELRGAQWGEIDFQAAVWTIPKERMKMKREHKIPLSAWSLELLHELHAITGQGAQLFPSRTKIGGYISENTLNKIIERIGFKELTTLHGFRSLASSTLNEKGFNPDAIELQLAHQPSDKIRAAYNRADYWQERVEMMAWYSGLLRGHYGE